MDADAAAPGPVQDVALPRAAAVLLLSVAAAAAGMSALAAVHVGAMHVDWTAFAVLAAGAILAHGGGEDGIRGWSFRPTEVFTVAALLLLPAALAAAAAALPYAAGAVRARHLLRTQLFDAANAALSVLVAAAAVRLLREAGADVALVDGAACVAFVLVNDAVLALMLRAGGGRPPRAGRLLEPEALATGLSLAALGVMTATAWRVDPWLIVFALAPLAVVHQALTLPRLVEESALDPKTQLYNARRFTQALAELSGRARRDHEPLAVVMADLDLLREINNTHGHLAGDAVLSGVAEVIRANVRADDFAARFGGEEFAILLPDTGVEQALEIAERIRAAVEAGAFHVDTSAEPIHATISIGVACYPRDAVDPQALVHAADVGLYEAKRRGRNRVVYAATAVFGSTARRNLPV